MDRRSFVRLGGFTAGGLWLGSAAACSSPPAYVPPGNGTPFTLGVMSGLHSSSEVVLWTRLEPSLAPGAGNVVWQIATDPTMVNVVGAGTIDVSPAADWTAKVLVGDLPADQSFWFRFLSDGVASPVGRARTLPTAGTDVERLNLAVGSCQNWTAGWYGAWAGIAAEDVDAVVWLGDYIYESSGSNPLTSVRDDPTEYAEDVETYRAKYKLYRSDPSLQAAHSAHPFVPVWDDHEFRNDFNRVVVAEESERFGAASSVWFEYMPVWPINGSQIYRSVQWGRLAGLSMLDTRQYRDPQANGFAGPDVRAFFGGGEIVREANLADRTILGAEQRTWLLDNLSAAQDDDVTWKLVCNQVMISPLRLVDLDNDLIRELNPNAIDHDGLYMNFDDWDSYQSERQRLLTHISDSGITNTSFLTGDVHAFWQSTLREDMEDPSSRQVANEFVCGSISSVGINIAGYDIAKLFENETANWSPPFRYADHRNNGYGLVEVTPENMSVTYRVNNAQARNAVSRDSVAFLLRDGVPNPTIARP